MSSSKKRTFADKLLEAIIEKKSILCVGLDPRVENIPKHIFKEAYEEAEEKNEFEVVARAFVIFCESIIKATASYAVAFKPQVAFFEMYGAPGIWAFKKIVEICKKHDLLVIADSKRGDGGDTAVAYAQGYLGQVDVYDPIEAKLIKKPSFNVDAITINPYIGTACVSPFIDEAKKEGKGVFILVKTSFKPSSEIEELLTGYRYTTRKIWEEVALLVKKWSKGCEGIYGLNNVGVVAGATYPEEIEVIAKILSNCFKLIPGYGAQGATADDAVKGWPCIVNSSREINYAYLRKFKCDPKQFDKAAEKAAEAAKNELKEALEKTGKAPW